VPESLPAAVERHAAAHPASPWLFDRRGWDWSWISWQDGAREVASRAAALAGLPAGAGVDIPDQPRPAALLAELAALAAGHTAVAEGRPLPSHADLQAGAAALTAVLGTGRERDIVVSGPGFADPADQRFLAWALVAGAAVLFDPDPASCIATAAWARPTVFQGTAAELAALAGHAAAFRPPWPRRRRPRLPFGRLRAVLPRGPLPAADAAFWKDRGVLVLDPG
jgi:hypothetical protein